MERNSYNNRNTAYRKIKHWKRQELRQWIVWKRCHLLFLNVQTAVTLIEKEYSRVHAPVECLDKHHYFNHFFFSILTSNRVSLTSYLTSSHNAYTHSMVMVARLVYINSVFWSEQLFWPVIVRDFQNALCWYILKISNLSSLHKAN